MGIRCCTATFSDYTPAGFAAGGIIARLGCGLQTGADTIINSLNLQADENVLILSAATLAGADPRYRRRNPARR